MGDSTPPSVTSFTMSNTTITWGETVTVTLVFSEAVSNFSSGDDITVQNGTLSTMTTSDNITWSGTLYPTNNINDNTNILTLANTYTDTAGNTGVGSTTSNYTVNTNVLEPIKFNNPLTKGNMINGIFSKKTTDLLSDAGSIVIRFGQIRFDLTGDLSANRIKDTSNNITRFSEFNLDYQNYFNDISGASYDISMNEWKKYFYQGNNLKPYRRQTFEDLAINELSGNIVFVKDVSNNDITVNNSNYTTTFFEEIKNHICASKNINSMQHLATDSLMFLMQVFGTAKNVDDLCVLFNRQKAFVWEFDGLHLDNLNTLLAMRYDQVNNVTTASDLINDRDTYPTTSNRWDAITSLFTNPASAPGNNWKNRTVYFALSLLFWTSESNIADIELLLYFRCSATGTVTMKTALTPSKGTS